MAKKDAYKYSVYNAVSKKLKADEIEAEGVVAGILLDTFLERNGVLKAADVYGKKSKARKGEPGKPLIGDEVGISFKAWRKRLVDLGWIIYDEDYAKRTRRFSDHKAGPKLIKYINKERLHQAEIATMDDIREIRVEKADRSEIAEIWQRLKALENMLNAVLKEYDPPVTAEKFAEYAADPQKMMRLIEGGSLNRNRQDGMVDLFRFVDLPAAGETS